VKRWAIDPAALKPGLEFSRQPASVACFTRRNFVCSNTPPIKRQFQYEGNDGEVIAAGGTPSWAAQAIAQENLQKKLKAEAHLAAKGSSVEDVVLHSAPNEELLEEDDLPPRGTFENPHIRNPSNAQRRALGLSTGITECPCGCGQPRAFCRFKPWGTSICSHGKYYQDCGTCNNKGKVVNRGKTCWAHKTRQCKSCKKATQVDGKQRFFGVIERARIAAGQLPPPA